MLIVETVAKIRRVYFGRGKPIKQIVRELRVSRSKRPVWLTCRSSLMRDNVHLA